MVQGVQSMRRRCSLEHLSIEGLGHMQQLAQHLTLATRVGAVIDIKRNQVNEHTTVAFSVQHLPIYFTYIPAATPRRLLGPAAAAAACQQKASAGATRSHLWR